MAHDTITSERSCGPWSVSRQRGTVAQDEAGTPGTPVGIVLVAFASMVMLGVLAKITGFGLLPSVLIGWAGSILGVLVRVLFVAWALEREERQAQAALRDARTTVPYRIVPDTTVALNGHASPGRPSPGAHRSGMVARGPTPGHPVGAGLSVARDADPMETVLAKRYR